MWPFNSKSKIGMIHVRTGLKGRWRWSVYIDGKYAFGQAVQGWETRDECIADLNRCGILDRHVLEV